MAAKRKKPVWEKLQISSLRRGEVQFDTAYNARDAAKIAAKRARQGWSVKVVKSGGGSYANKRIPPAMMTCEPSVTAAVQSVGYLNKTGIHRKPFARCTMTPAFKKRVTGR